MLPVSPSFRKPRTEILSAWIGLLLASGITLRLISLGTKSFWPDEAASVAIAQLTWHDLIRVLVNRQANMALYYFVLRLWIRLGSNESIVRLLSLAFGSATIVAIYFLGENLFGSKVGRIAAMIASCHVFLIEYSQEARAYSLLVLLAVLSSLFFVRSIQSASSSNRAAYIVFSSLLVYAQVCGVLVLLSQWVSLPLLKRRISWKSFLTSATLIVIAILPLAYCLLLRSDRSQIFWLSQPSWADTYRFVLDLTGDGGSVLLLLYSVLLCFEVLSAWSAGSSGTTDLFWRVAFLSIWTFLPGFLLLLISLHWPAFRSRYLIFCVPPLLLLVSSALSRMKSRAIFGISLLAVLLFSLNGVFAYYRYRSDSARNDDWRDATRFVLLRARRGDSVLFTYSEERLAFNYYQRQFGMCNLPIESVPQGTDYDLLVQRPTRPDTKTLDAIARDHSRVWIVSAFQPDAVSRHAVELFDVSYSQHMIQNFGFVRTEFFARAQ